MSLLLCCSADPKSCFRLKYSPASLPGCASLPAPGSPTLPPHPPACTVTPFKAWKDERVCSIDQTGKKWDTLAASPCESRRPQWGSHTRGIGFESHPRLLAFHHSSSSLIRRENETGEGAEGGISVKKNQDEWKENERHLGKGERKAGTRGVMKAACGQESRRD